MRGYATALGDWQVWTAASCSVCTGTPALHRLAKVREYCMPYWSSLPQPASHAAIIACTQGRGLSGMQNRALRWNFQSIVQGALCKAPLELRRA